jgi:hypothetical protein
MFEVRASTYWDTWINLAVAAPVNERTLCQSSSRAAKFRGFTPDRCCPILRWRVFYDAWTRASLATVVPSIRLAGETSIYGDAPCRILKARGAHRPAGQRFLLGFLFRLRFAYALNKVSTVTDSRLRGWDWQKAGKK